MIKLFNTALSYYKTKPFIKIIVILTFSVIIIYLSLANFNQDNKIQINLPYFDKLIHFIMYFAYSITILFSFRCARTIHFAVIIYCIIFGIMLEIIQEYVVLQRTGDITDALSNAAGVLTGYLFYQKLNSL
jgi:VanZ family protein